jgi:Cache 3/Cache 2 fusion domain
VRFITAWCFSSPPGAFHHRSHTPFLFLLKNLAMTTTAQFFAAAALFALSSLALAQDPKATIADLDTRLAKIGSVKIDGTEVVAGKAVPAIYFGERKINNNYDVVDAVRKAHNATATVFVKDGDEFVRVSTNVLTPEGKRGVGTQLARNAAYAAVSKGMQFCGPIDVLGTAYDACYNPIKDAKGVVVGVSYIGHKK